jgi:hypothetical protein
LDANFCKKCGARLTETPSADAFISAEKSVRRQSMAESSVRLNAPAASEAPNGERKTVTALFADSSVDCVDRLSSRHDSARCALSLEFVLSRTRQLSEGVSKRWRK